MIYVKHGRIVFKGDGAELLAELSCAITKLAELTEVDAGQLGADIVNHILRNEQRTNN